MTEVRLTSADRVLFPEDGVTKGDLFEYYGQIAPVLIPHLKNRPFTMKRWPRGIREESYFQKQAPKGLPDWVKTKQFRTHPREGGSRLVDFVLVNDERTLLTMVQLNCVDMNAWYSRVDYLPSITDPMDDYRLRGETGLLVPLLEQLSFKASVIDDYNALPAEDTSANSLTTLLGLSLMY